MSRESDRRINQAANLRLCGSPAPPDLATRFGQSCIAHVDTEGRHVGDHRTFDLRWANEDRSGVEK